MNEDIVCMRAIALDISEVDPLAETLQNGELLSTQFMQMAQPLPGVSEPMEIMVELLRVRETLKPHVREGLSTFSEVMHVIADLHSSPSTKDVVNRLVRYLTPMMPEQRSDGLLAGLRFQ